MGLSGLSRRVFFFKVATLDDLFFFVMLGVSVVGLLLVVRYLFM